MDSTTKPTTPPRNAGDEIKRTASMLLQPGEVAELRHIFPGFKGRKEIHSGYFGDPDKLAQAAVKCQGGNVYISLNPVVDSLLARRTNRIDVAGDGDATKDQHIARRRWLLIDCDPVRESGISATGEEKQEAKAKAREVARFLSDRGWPTPAHADSGNGFHNLYRIDLPNDDGSTTLVKRVLVTLSDLFTDEPVSIDTTVFNAARITKLYGTVAGKGDHTADRPHRVSRLLHIPDDLQVVTREQLEHLAGPEPPPPPPRNHHSHHNGDAFDLPVWIGQHLEVKSEGPYTNPNKAVHRWKLTTCPLCGESDGSAVVLQYADGRHGYKCHHNRCAGARLVAPAGALRARLSGPAA